MRCVLLGQSRELPVITINHNLYLFSSLSRLPDFYNFAWEAGLLGLYPTPTAHTYAFLFKHTLAFQVWRRRKITLRMLTTVRLWWRLACGGVCGAVDMQCWSYGRGSV
jgi:hypothetical protein